MKHLYFFIFLILIWGCEKKQESIDFLEPQPTNVENANGFNKHYQGQYRNPNDSSQLLILKDKIIKIKNIKLVFSRYDIDSTFKGDKTSDEQIENALKKENIVVDKFIKDSIYSTWTIKDTIFNISDQNLCRLFKGSYFLNYTDDDLTWKVERLDLNKNRLTFSLIMPNDSLFSVLPVKNKYIIKDDSGGVKSYQIKPSKKELKQLVKSNSFIKSDEWIKEK